MSSFVTAFITEDGRHFMRLKEAAEKRPCSVILSEAKNLSSI